MLSSLTRRLGTADAVALGLAAMLGSGVFAAFAPAAAAAGGWLLVAVAVAAVAAYCSALSTADLAVAHPESGGGEVSVRDRLTPGTARLAGVAHLVGKVTSAAAAAEVFGAYVLPARPTVCAVVVLVVAVATALTGLHWTPGSAWLLVGGTLAVLAVVVVVGLLGPGGGSGVSAVAEAPVPVPVVPGPVGVLTAAALVFFAFGGFSRVATIGEELRDPDRSLGRAVTISFVVLTLTYLAVAGALLVGLGAGRLAAEQAPLVTLVDTGQAPALGVLVRIGAAVAAGSVVLAVLAAAGRTMQALARRRELPRAFGRSGGRPATWPAAVSAGVLAIVVVLLADTATAIAVSACALLLHYVLVNLAALRLSRARRHRPAWTSLLGAVLCGVLAILLPIGPLLVTIGALAVGWLLCTVIARFATHADPPAG